MFLALAPERTSTLRQLVKKVVVKETGIDVHLAREEFLGKSAQDAGAHVLAVQASLKRCGRDMRLVLSDGSLAQGAESDPALVKVLERAGHWGNLLVCGKVKSVCDLAQQEGVGVSYVKRLLPLAFLAPDIRDAIMEGKQPAELSAQRLTHLPSLPLAWDEQRKILGFTN